MLRIAIIGGGAAGLMVAATILEINPSARLEFFERNSELGKKVKISGGGRCNVTTGITDIKTVLTKYPRGGKFLNSAMHAFSPSDMVEWVEAHGVPLKVEEDLRVFPVSNQSEDIVGIFAKLLDTPNVDILLNTSVTSIKRIKKEFHISTKESAKPIIADRVIITTGGQAYRKTGSTGDGYAFAQSLGHTITPLAPSLSSFLTAETWPAEISGVSFPYAAFSVPNHNAKSEGSFLFTHKGISGPAVFALSSQLAFEKFDVQHPIEVRIDLFPDVKIDTLMKKIIALVQMSPKKSVANLISTMIPKSLSDIICSELGLDPKRHAIEYSKKQLEETITHLKQLNLHIVGRGAGDEFVTAGGVDLTEVDPKTMESKLCPSLFFAGEILDIDGFTGGFNLQASWATGRAAGLNVSQ
ncbi:MAG: NAD(P)/FAD-dependent oxidoreductase [Patescibacteria group bacterium]